MATGDDPDTTTRIELGERSQETSNPPMRPAARLVALVGGEVGRVYPMSHRTITIGRSHDCDVRVEGPDVSRMHARIVWERDKYLVEDTSRNGTSVNGLPIGRHHLLAGDRIQIAGSAILVFAHHDDLEERVARLQKLESLAQLAGGVVHDVRNMIGVILTNAELLLLEHQRLGVTGEEAARTVRDIQAAARSGLERAQSLLHFSRRNEVTGWTEMRVEALVEGALALVRGSSRAGPGIEIETLIDPALRIRGSRDDLQHALLNLLLNALDAMPRGGTLRVVGRHRKVHRIEALRLHLALSGSFLELSITDTGIGMDDAVLARIFEPFFTTKEPGRGTGLGLSTAYGVVRNHGGNILVQSAAMQGTTFELLLPAVASETGAAPPMQDG